MRLNLIHCKQQATITNVKVTGLEGRRLYEMGFLPGTKIIVTHKAPFGFPISVSVRGYELILGFDEADALEVSLD